MPFIYLGGSSLPSSPTDPPHPYVRTQFKLDFLRDPFFSIGSDLPGWWGEGGECDCSFKTLKPLRFRSVSNGTVRFLSAGTLSVHSLLYPQHYE